MNNAIAHNALAFAVSGGVNSEVQSITNHVFNSSTLANEFTNTVEDNYYPNLNGNLYQTATALTNDTFNVDLNGEDRVAYTSIDIGALISLPELNGEGNSEDDVSSSIQKSHDEMSLRVYPNPATNAFSISMSGVEKVDLIDLNGRTQQLRISESGLINTHQLTNGAYLLLVRKSNQVYQTKLIVSR